MKKITKILSLFFMLTFALVVTACGEDPVEISFDNADETMIVGDELQLKYTVSDTTVSLEWSVDDPSLLEINQTGNVKALKNGVANVTVKVKDEEISATIKVTINPKPVINPTTVVLSDTVDSGKVGQSFTFKATVLPAGADQSVTWSTNLANVATVSEAGVVNLVGVGQVFITATSKKDNTKFAEIEITVGEPDPTSLAISSFEDKTEITVYSKLQFTAVAAPEFALSTVTWSVDNAALADISATGELEAKAAGTVVVTATSTIVETVTATFTLTIVQPLPESVTVTGSLDILAKGEDVTLTTAVLPAIAIQTVTFSSSNEAVATVDATGKVVAVGAGDAVITVKTTALDTVTATYNVKVVDLSTLVYTKANILLDKTLVAKRFEKITVDTTDYYFGLNAFSSAKAAFDALEENSVLTVKKGAYDEAVAIKVNGVKVLGPNVDKPAGKDLFNRVAEAVFSQVITLDGVQDIVIDGISITGVSQIKSTKPVKNILVQNLNSFSPSVPSGEGVIFGGVKTGTEINENYVVKNSRFVDTFGEGPAGGYRGIRINNAKDIEISNNYFVGFYDTIRLEGEVSAGANTGAGASGNIVIKNNEFENNFQYAIWIGTYHSANITIDSNYIASRPEYSGVYGHLYVVGHKPSDVKSVVNVTNNEMPYKVAGWHQFRFNSQGSTPEQLEINVNYNIFHEVAGSDADGQYTHIADHYKETSTFVINGANNYYLYEGDVKAEYFLRTTYEPNFRELSDELKVASVKREIPALIMDDYMLPTMDGLAWSLKEGQDATLYNIETGELLRFPGAGEDLVVVATINSVAYEITLHFGIVDANLTQRYYNSSDTFAAASGGTFDTQVARAGFGGYTIIVNGMQFFIGKNAYISLVGETEEQVFTKEQLRPLGLGSATELYNNGLVTGGVVSTSQRGYGVLYENTGTVAIKFNLSNTYGRNNASFAGYGKVKFVPQTDGTYLVKAHESDSGTNTTDTGVELTLQPGEMLWCPHTWDTKSGTYLSSPKTGGFEGGALAENAVLKIVEFKTFE